jgi:hypothetical protein
MSNNIILEPRFTAHQKTHILFSIGAPIVLIIIILIGMNLNYKGYIILFLIILIYFSMICLAFSRRGLLKKGSDLYRGLYFKNILLLKKKINLTNKTKISILRFRRSQKMAWFSIARPDLATGFNAFDINLLNHKHTQRELLISFRNIDNANKAIDFLETNFDLKHEIYSPDFS